MATKKLTIEVDADTKKAQQKLAQLNAGGDAAGGGAADAAARSADKAAKALDKAAKGADGLGESAKAGAANLQGMAKLFGGMAIRMAAGFAAQNMQDGAAKTAVGAVGSIAGGAMAGAAFGPWGAVAGGALGAGEAIVGAVGAANARQAAIDKYSDEFDRSERSYADSRAFADRLEALTKVEKGFDDFAGRIAEISAELEKYREVEKTLVANVRAFAEAGDLDKAGLQSGYLNGNRQRQAQLEAAAKAMEAQQQAAAGRTGPAFRVSTDALDALSRIGGGTGGGDWARQQLEAQKETVTVLRSIDRKTNGGATWQ